MGSHTSAFGSLMTYLPLFSALLIVLLPLSSYGRPVDQLEEKSVPKVMERQVAFATAAAATNAEEGSSTTWALLVAGSNGYENYRHQANVCHAYQILKRGGLKEENIVVMMYDDIAHDPLNPTPGVIVNHPNGSDVYAGVPKDYTGEYVTAKNMYAVILGDKEAVQGGSGKVIDSKPNDRIFIYYTDHGGAGTLGMPNAPVVVAGDFIDVLKKKHESNSYKEMVIYAEACQSGSIFQGLMPENLNIYVTTSASPTEESWAAYCSGWPFSPGPEKYQTCLGDLYSVAWLEDSEKHNLKLETVGDQYKRVKLRTEAGFKSNQPASHVMEFGYKGIKPEKLYLYQGFDPANANATEINGLNPSLPMAVVNQRDADILSLWKIYEDENSNSKEDILKKITETIRHRVHLDNSIDLIGKLIFGYANGPSTLSAVRPPAQALVDDWGCFKSMVRVFESRCGSLTQYGMKHMRAFANICNKGVSEGIMDEACASTCRSYDLDDQWSPYIHGYSA